VNLRNREIPFNHQRHKMARKKFMERTGMKAINVNAMNFFRAVRDFRG